MLALEFAGEHVSGCSEHADALIRNVAASADDQLQIAVSNRVRHHQDGKACMPYALGDHLRKGSERGTDHRDGGDAKIFEFDRVTRGPGG